MKKNFLALIKQINLFSEIILGIIFIYSVIVLIATVGFYLDKNTIFLLIKITNLSLLLFVLQELARIVFDKNKKKYVYERWFELAISILFLLILIFPSFTINIINDLKSNIGGNLSAVEIYSINLTFIDLLLIITFLLKSTRYIDAIMKLNLHPSAIFALSFALIIFTGAIFLSLPKATVDGETTSFIDALFTSTSAVCVTGLVVHNTATHFTFFGKVIILLLIQTGGLGVMTLTTFFATIIAGGLSVKARFLMKEYLSQINVETVGKLLLKILQYTFIIETIGAIFLFIFGKSNEDKDFLSHIFNSIFHSISAFCNAGFSTYKDGMMQNLIQNNYWYLSGIMGLIVLGGLGFAVLVELSQLLKFKNLFNFKLYIKSKLSVSAKIVLLTTFALNIIGSILIFIISPNIFQSLGTTFNTFFHSVFTTISAKTAGYNSVPMELYSFPIAFVIIFLMWVGASPGSTGGGIKTTTFFLAFYSLLSQIRGKERVEVFKKELQPNNLTSAYLVIIANLLSLSIGIFFTFII
jgi:Trk-type K+ transport system membrane component